MAQSSTSDSLLRQSSAAQRRAARLGSLPDSVRALMAMALAHHQCDRLRAQRFVTTPLELRALRSLRNSDFGSFWVVAEWPPVVSCTGVVAYAFRLRRGDGCFKIA